MLVLLAPALLSAPAAAGDDVLWYDGNGGYSAGVTALSDALLAAGATGFDDTNVWPASLSSYQLVFIDTPDIAYTATQTADLAAYVATGRTLVLIGENDTSFSATNTVHNALLADLGLGSTFLDASYDSGCGHWATVAATHAFTDGVTTVQYASSGDLAPGSAATVLLTGESGQNLLLVEGTVVLASDLNMFVDNCSLDPAQDTLFVDLLGGICGAVDDADADGEIASCIGGPDCDDTDPAVNTTAVETCNGVDDNCDGLTDGADSTGLLPWYLDADADGYGDATAPTADACDVPSGYTADATDCDDADGAIHPGGTEHCNGTDDDCDTLVDEDVVDGAPFHADADADGYGDPDAMVSDCTAPTGYVDDATDCDDTRADTHPGADEVCDGVDNNCDDREEFGAIDAVPWYSDEDGDGYAGADVTTYACSQPDGLLPTGDDCDDTRASVYPGADEVCDAIDDDCDTTVDEDAVDASSWYTDADGDGYGDPDAAAIAACTRPDGAVANADDCDDADPTVWPGAPGWSATCAPVDAASGTGKGETGAAGCGCATGEAGAGSWITLGLLAAALGRRRTSLLPVRGEKVARSAG